MNAKLKQNRQMRSIMIAFAVSILAAVATMFVPVAVLESITGASGLSELVPATAAPLGDTARALISFAAGALTLALMAVLLLRQNAVKNTQSAEPEMPAAIAESDDRDPITSFKGLLAKLPFPKMPWVKGDDDITDLSDLPKLRGGDVHPDAPPRRPLSATHDLPVLDLTEMSAEPVTKVVAETTPVFVDEPAPKVTEAPTAVVDIQPSRASLQPTLAEMVAQLEASVAQRQQQLAELEIVAANLAASKSAEPIPPVEAAIVEPTAPAAAIEMSVEPSRPEWPPLEVVPASPAKQDDMDDALAAALATLHRMNGTGG